MANQVSSCCHASIYEGKKTEYPLGGRTYGMNYRILVCEDCNKETDSIEGCEYCGEPSDKPMIVTEFGDWCHVCVSSIFGLKKVSE